MRIALFSDIHGNLQALEAIIENIKKDDVEHIICLGDVIGLGPNSKECLDLLINNNIELILGNHELYYLYGTKNENMNNGELKHHEFIESQLSQYHYRFLKKSPIEMIIKYKENSIKLAHFFIKDKTKTNPFYPLSILKTDYKELLSNQVFNYMFIGHQHSAFREQIDDKWIIDVGSSGARRDNMTSYYIIEINEEIKVEGKLIEYDRLEFEYNLDNVSYPEKENISRIFFGIND